MPNDDQSLRAQEAVRALVEDLFGPSLPWYDSPWLQTFMRVRGFLGEKHPEQVSSFENMLAPLRTDPGFQATHLPNFVDAATMADLRAEVDAIVRGPTSNYEQGSFGRDLLHNRPLFTTLAESLSGLVGDVVGEPVEPCYNFLSLYGPAGKCEPHMDSPEAKWTVDICIDQSDRWPLYLSPVLPWPTDWDKSNNDEWQNYIRSENSFASITMDPSDAIIFGGSSQWHYRDPFPTTLPTPGFCHLLFLHYIPAGCSEIVKPANWGSLLDLPSIHSLCEKHSSHYGTA